MTENKTKPVVAGEPVKKDQRLDYARVFKLKNGDTIIALIGGLGYQLDIPVYQIFTPMAVFGPDECVLYFWESADNEFILQKGDCLFPPAKPTDQLIVAYLKELDEKVLRDEMAAKTEQTEH